MVKPYQAKADAKAIFFSHFAQMDRTALKSNVYWHRFRFCLAWQVNWEILRTH